MGHLDIKKMLLLTVNRAFLSYYILSIILYRVQLWFHLVTSIKVSVGLFATEIYANWVRKEELERWV